MLIPDQLERLLQAAMAAAKKFDAPVEGVFDSCGLLLEMPPLEQPYWCTPQNALTFASTGGDGVHYSYLDGVDLPDGIVPVVMTLPSADESNVIIAESFEEFFNLGYYVGWFSLEQIVHEGESSLPYFSQAEEEQDDEAGSRLAFLRHALNMRPAPPRHDRLAWLKDRYYNLLHIADLPEED